MMKKIANGMPGWALSSVLAALACWASVSHGKEQQDEKDKTLVTIRLVSDDPERALPKTIAEEDLVIIPRISVSIGFFQKERERYGTGRQLANVEYNNGVVKAWMDTPRKIFESAGAHAIIKEFDECQIRFTLSTGREFPWEVPLRAKPEPLTVTDPDLRELEVVMPVQYNRSVAEGHPSVKVAFQLLSGATGEPIARYRINANSPMWHVRSQQRVWTDEQGVFHLNVYGDEDHLMLYGGRLGPMQPDRLREAKVSGDLVRKHIESATPLVLKGETPRIRGRIEIDDPEQQKLMETLKGHVSLEYIKRPGYYIGDSATIDNGRFYVYGGDGGLEKLVKTGMKSRIRGFGEDFEAYVLAKPVEFNLPEKGANEELVVRVVAPTTVDALIRVQASRDGRPVEGAVVILERRGEKPIRLTAGPNGEVSARVPVGEYSLSASAPGFADKSQEGARILGADALEIRLRKLVDFEVAAEGPGSEELAMVMAVSLESDAERSASFPEGQSRATVRRVPEGKAMIMLADRKGRVAGVKSIEVEEGKSERIVLREPVPLNLRVEVDKKRLDHMSVMLLDKQTRCPMHPAHLAGKPLATMLPPGVYEVFAILPPGLLPPNPESEEPGAFPFMTQTWVLLGEADLSKASAKEEVELVLEFPKHFKPLLRSDVLHPAFR